MKNNLFAKITAYFIVTLLVLSFAIWGIADYLGYIGSQQPWLAKVDETEIGREEVLAEYRNTLRSIGLSGLDKEQARQINIVETILNRMINHTLLQAESQRLGMRLNIDALKAYIQRDPQFTNPETSRFDVNLFQRYLHESGQSEQGFVDNLRDNIYVFVLNRANLQFAPPHLSTRLYDWQFEERKVKVLNFPLPATNDIPRPSDTTLQTYYKENPDQFLVDKNRSIQLIEIKFNDVIRAINVSMSDIEQRYLNEKDRFFVAKKARVRRILFKDEETGQQAFDAYNLQAKPSFERLAEEFDREIENLGMITEGSTISVLEDAVFARNTDGITPVIALPIGFALFFVDNIEEERQLTLDDDTVRATIEREIKIDRGYDAIYNRSIELTDALASGESFAKVARDLELKNRNLRNLTEGGFDALTGEQIATLNPIIVSEAFETSVGETSLVLEDGNNGYFVVNVLAENPERIRPFEDIRNLVYTAWLFDTRMESAVNTLLERANAFINREISETEINAFAKEMAVEAISSAYFSRSGQRSSLDNTEILPPPNLIDDIYRMKKGYVLVSKNTSGPLMLWLEDVQKPSAARLQDFAESEWNNTTFNATSGALEQTLRQKASIEYNYDAIKALYDIL